MGSQPTRTFWVYVALLAGSLSAGCASFPLQPYHVMSVESWQRTEALRNASPPLTANRAASLSGRSQTQVKARLKSLWHMSTTLDALVNRNGLLATRYSQLDTIPGRAFRSREIEVPHLGTMVRVRAIEAFQADRRLPLVIGVSGINGTVDGKSTVDILQSLYDSGEFHVMHLESLTSVNHQVRNQQPFLGGFPEGLLLYRVAAELRSSPDLSEQISQIHLLGLSFGGLLCGIAAHCEDKIQSGVVDGAVLALSPPMDLATLFDNLNHSPLIHDRVHRGYLKDGVRRYFRHNEFGLNAGELAHLKFDSYMRRLAFPQFQKSYARLKEECFDLATVNDADGLYAISSVRPHLDSLGVPYFFIFAYDDPVLSPADHFQRTLRACSNPLVDGLLVEHGGHLGFDLVTGYPFTSRAALEYFRYWSTTLPNAS